MLTVDQVMLGTRGSKNGSRAASIREDTLGNTSLKLILVEVNRSLILTLRQLKEVELIVRLFHLALPVFVVVVAVVPEELLVQKLRQDALRSQILRFIGKWDLNFLSSALPELSLSLLSELLLDALLSGIDRLNESFRDELFE